MINDKEIYNLSKTMNNFDIPNKPQILKKKPITKNTPKNIPLSKTTSNTFYNKIKKQKKNFGILDNTSFRTKKIIIDSEQDKYHSTQFPKRKKTSKKNVTNLYKNKPEYKNSNNNTKLSEDFVKGYYIIGQNRPKKFIEKDSIEIGNHSSIPLGVIKVGNYLKIEDNNISLSKNNINTKSDYLKNNAFHDKKLYNDYILNPNKKLNNNPICSMENPSPIFLNNSNNIFNDEYLNQTYCQKSIIKTTESADHDTNEINSENYSYYNYKNIDNNKNKKSIVNKQNNNNEIDRYYEVNMENLNINKETKKFISQNQPINNELSEIVNFSNGLRNLLNDSVEFKNDENENSKITQDFNRNSFYKNIYATKIQALWRGFNIRKIINLYNDLDEFIFHISKVEYNKFRNDFYFFISQLFKKYEEKIMYDFSKESNENEKNINSNKKDDAYQDKNEINLFFCKKENDKENNLEELQKKYDDLYKKYNDLLNLYNSEINQNNKSNNATTTGFENINDSINHNNKFKETNESTNKIRNGYLIFSNNPEVDLDRKYLLNQKENLKNNYNENSSLYINKFNYSTINSYGNRVNKFFDYISPKNKKKFKNNNDKYSIELNNLRRKNYKLNSPNSKSEKKNRNFSKNLRTQKNNIQNNTINISKQNINDFVNNNEYDKYLANFKKNLRIEKNVIFDINKLDKIENKICKNKELVLLSEYSYGKDEGYYYDIEKKKIIEKTKEANKVTGKNKATPKKFDQNKIIPKNENYFEFIIPKKSMDQLAIEIFDNEKLVQKIEKKLMALKPILKPTILKQNSFEITKSKKNLIKELPKLISEIETNINNLQIVQNTHRNFSPTKLNLDKNDLFIGEKCNLPKNKKFEKLIPTTNEINLNIKNLKTEPIIFSTNKIMPSKIDNNFSIYNEKIKSDNLISKEKPISIKKTKSPKKFDEKEFEIENIIKNNISVTKPKLKIKIYKIDQNTKFEIQSSNNKQIIQNNASQYINNTVIFEEERQTPITIYNDYVYILDKNRSPVDGFTSP